MIWVYCAIALLLACFAVSVLIGPPYVPTLDKQMVSALDMLKLKPSQMMIELGCGDGKVLVAAAQRGWKVVGIEINPLLLAVCWWRTRHYRNQVRLVWGNYWRVGKWPPQAEAMFGFVLPRYMAKLDGLLQAYQKRQGTELRLASFAFKIPGRKIIRERDGVFLYVYK